MVISNNTSAIVQNQQLLVRFPNLGAHDVIVRGTARAFKITLNSEDANRTVVQNLGRAIVRKTTTKISGNEMMSIDDSDVYHCYNDLWKAAQARENAQYQGIDESDNRNTTRIRVSAGNKNASVAADKAYSNRFYIPLDFDLLESHMPFYRSAFGDRLEFEFTVNDYNRMIWATGDTDASYDIENISLEYDMVTEPELASTISNQYSERLAILYDRILRHRKIRKDKSDTI